VLNVLFCEIRPEDAAVQRLPLARLWACLESLGSAAALAQLGVAACVLAAALLAGRRLGPRFAAAGWAARFPRFAAALPRLLAPLLAAGLLGLAAGLAAELGAGFRVLEFAAALCLAWAASRLFSVALASRFQVRCLTLLAFGLALLHGLGLTGALGRQLHGLGLSFGGTYVSLLSLAKALALGIGLALAARGVSGFAERRLAELPQISPSLQVLFVKGLKFVLFTLAVIAALGAVGVDLTGLAVFTGAAGVAVGFGLQKIFSNLVAGLILLLDRSIKPGDVVEVGGTVGVINALNARFVSILTADGTELLVPNEDLVASRVVNWSYSARAVRLAVPVGVAYGADLRRALALLERAAAGVERVLADPRPKAWLAKFGDSSIDLELGFWINDPQNGVANVKGQVLLAVWDEFKAHGIEIPFPQREVRVKEFPARRPAGE
jgi:small-conductance mechanosensitive channel